MRILLTEDDQAIGGAVRDHLAADGHAVDWATSIALAREYGAVAVYDLMLLDLHLPDGSGIALLREIRRREERLPVIILTAMDQISDRIEGLNAGADDYLVKPFDLGELLARIHAVARRAKARPGPVITIGAVEINSPERALTRGADHVELTAREWAVLDCLLDRRGSIVSKIQIEDALYEFGAEIESNAVEVYISRLRKKLGAGLIKTTRGIGYRLGES